MALIHEALDDILMVRRLTVNEFAFAVGGSIPSRSIVIMNPRRERTCFFQRAYAPAHQRCAIVSLVFPIAQQDCAIGTKLEVN